MNKDEILIVKTLRENVITAFRKENPVKLPLITYRNHVLGYGRIQH